MGRLRWTPAIAIRDCDVVVFLCPNLMRAAEAFAAELTRRGFDVGVDLLTTDDMARHLPHSDRFIHHAWFQEPDAKPPRPSVRSLFPDGTHLHECEDIRLRNERQPWSMPAWVCRGIFGAFVVRNVASAATLTDCLFVSTEGRVSFLEMFEICPHMIPFFVLTGWNPVDVRMLASLGVRVHRTKVG